MMHGLGHEKTDWNKSGVPDQLSVLSFTSTVAEGSTSVQQPS